MASKKSKKENDAKAPAPGYASNSDKNADYQAEDDARTLQRAHEVLSDSERHGKARKHLGKMAVHAKAAAGLKKAFPDDSNMEGAENC